MEEKQLSELKAQIAELDSRLRRLELPDLPEVASTLLPNPQTITQPIKKVETPPTNLLGVLGVGCLLVAMILLIKFSIDSGWLTPTRQLFLAALFGTSLIAAPYVIKSDDKIYLSLLASGGIVVLHLTIYGAIFYHHLIGPMIGLWMVWAVSALSLWLLNTFKGDIFAIFAIAGTYLGSYLLKDSFADLSLMAAHLLVWDIVFAGFAIKLKNRSLISLAAYFSLGLVIFFGFSLSGTVSAFQAQQIATIQLLQILIYTLATSLYSVSNKLTLTEREAGQLAPVFLFFYGQEFYYLDLINPVYATVFSLSFATLILGVYAAARKKLAKDHLESSSSVFTCVTIMYLHSIYFVNLGDQGKLIFGLILMMVMAKFSEVLKIKSLKNSLMLFLLVIGYSMMLILRSSDNLSTPQVFAFGLMYGIFLLLGYRTSLNKMILAAANIMIIVAISRLSQVIGEIWVAPLCVAYAFASLLVALKRSDKVLAKASLPVIVFAIGRFLFFNFEILSPGERIISLIVMGALIYAGGFVYRKIPIKG